MSFWTAGLCGITVCFSGSLAANVGHAQDLAPRAYVITPIHSNAITLTYSFFDGSLVFEGTIPITGAQARVNVTIFNYSHSLKLFGRTANFTGSLPYGIGHLRGTVVGAEALAYRSGLLPASVRFSVNLVGGPAMNVAEYTKWRHDKPKWSRKLQHSSAEFAGRSYCCDPFKQASVNKTKLQQWRIRSVRGELSKCLCGLAIFLAGET